MSTVGDRFQIERNDYQPGIGGRLEMSSRDSTSPRTGPDSSAREGYVRLYAVSEGLLLNVNLFQGEGLADLPRPLTTLSDSAPAFTGERDEVGERELLAEAVSRLGDAPLPVTSTSPDALPNPGRENLFQRAKAEIVSDYQNFYSVDGLKKLTIGLGLAAIVANTQMDRETQEQVQEHLRSRGSDSFAKVVKPLGDGSNTIPIYVGAFVLGELTDKVPYVGEWGERSLRALAVGVPPLLFVQKLTGGERPDADTSSRWTPWRNNHGASGHAFMGAIPFLTAAKMADDPWLKGAFYIGSTMTAWSRMNDNAHYPSQAALGWWLACLSVSAADLTNMQLENVSVTPMPVRDGMGLGIEIRR